MLPIPNSFPVRLPFLGGRTSRSQHEVTVEIMSLDVTPTSSVIRCVCVTYNYILTATIVFLCFYFFCFVFSFQTMLYSTITNNNLLVTVFFHEQLKETEKYIKHEVL